MTDAEPRTASSRRLAKPVAMSAGGRLTLPAEAREELGIKGEAQFQVEVIPGGLVLREAITVPSEDAWAYTSEYRAQVDRSRRDHAEGRSRAVSVEELDHLAGLPPGRG